jgi:hypothetical protein
VLKIPKYSNTTSANSLIGRLPFTNRNHNYEQSRTRHRFFFKPYIDIISYLNDNRKTIPIKLNDNSNNQLEICIWTIKIHNKDDRKIKLKFAKNATDCNCHIDILKDKKSIISSELYIIDNLSDFEIDNNEIDIGKSIKKYCSILNTYLKNDTKITRDSFKELLFLITIKDSQFMYLLEKQTVSVLEEYNNSVVEYRSELVPRKLQVGIYDLSLVFNCKEKKDERGRRYTLDVSSWQDVELVES